jgi:hypothetical protein
MKIRVSWTLPADLTKTATVGTADDWLIIQKSGESELSKIAAVPAAVGAAALAGSSSQDFAVNTLTAASGIVIPNASTIWNASYSSGIDFASGRVVTFYASEFKCYDAAVSAWAPITAKSLYCASGGISVGGDIGAITRGSYDLGTSAAAFRELYLAAGSDTLGKYDHTAIYTSADGFKIRTASVSGSTWSFSTTLKPLFSSDSGHTSNKRLKRDIEPLTGARATLKATAPCSFKMKTDEPGARRRVGFIAEDLEIVFPEAVMPIGDTFEEDGAPVKAVLIMPLIAEAVQAVKEQDDVLETHTTQIGALSAALASSTKRLEAAEDQIAPVVKAVQELHGLLQEERQARLALEQRMAALEMALGPSGASRAKD